MWTRKKLKDRAKFALRQNYWKIVLVALMAGLLIGGGGAYSGYGQNHGKSQSQSERVIHETSSREGIWDDLEVDEEDSGASASLQQEKLNRMVDENWPLIICIVIAVIVIILVVLALAVVLDAFILNPFEVGAKRFFSHSIVQKAEVKEIA
ncbi:MAG: hypothetical protein Q4D32_03470, partial [Eubacteriales bacterium]|nr:hypothetical protein [Eubacteriales bacterium]